MRRPYAERVDFSAPLPLGHTRVIERALELRLANPSVYTWPTIEAVMAEYHGFHRSEHWWRLQLRGKVPARPHGEHAFRAAA